MLPISRLPLAFQASHNRQACRQSMGTSLPLPALSCAFGIAAHRQHQACAHLQIIWLATERVDSCQQDSKVHDRHGFRHMELCMNATCTFGYMGVRSN